MDSILRLRLIVLSAIAMVVMNSQDVKRSCAATRPDGGQDVLSLGTVTVIGSVNCPAGAATGASCTEITVSCPDANGGPDLPNLDAILGVTYPTGPTIGTIILLSGGKGTDFFNNGFPHDYVNNGFQVVQLAWASDWADANHAGVKSAACRPSTVFQYVFNTVHGDSRTKAFCGQGLSGGGAALAYSLADYGFADYFDYIAIAAGPGVARMDYGCHPKLYTGGPRDLCPLIPDAAFAYDFGTAKKVNTWEGTRTCGQSYRDPNEISKWESDSIISAGASYSYPNTGVSSYYCAKSPDFSTGQGSFLVAQILAKNSAVTCFSGCAGEDVWSDQDTIQTTENDVLAQCVPNH